MSRQSMLKTGICVALLVLGTAVSAAAQVVVIRRGTFIVPSQFPPAYVDVSGTRGFRFQGIAVGWGFTAMTQCGEGCLPGLVVPLEAEVSTGNLNGTARLQGTTYVDIGSTSSHETLVLMFSGQVTMPAISDGPVTVTVPFDLTGEFSYEEAGERHKFLLTGGGTVTLFLQPSPDGTSWIVTRADFVVRNVRR